DYRRVPSYANLLNVGVAFDEPSKVAVTGNSNQKIRQYLSVGVPVVAGGGGNAFLKEEKLGDVVDGGDNAAILESISKWLALSAKGRKEFASRARDYAVANLSVGQALEARLGMWAQRL
ncbi:MAG: hypothetical protein JRI47_00675, partial [Deltaproteobacteria bacterium]|nr:hypothetical protein [Deltaproteobacteria bacterium]